MLRAMEVMLLLASCLAVDVCPEHTNDDGNGNCNPEPGYSWSFFDSSCCKAGERPRWGCGVLAFWPTLFPTCSYTANYLQSDEFWAILFVAVVVLFGGRCCRWLCAQTDSASARSTSDSSESLVANEAAQRQNAAKEAAQIQARRVRPIVHFEGAMCLTKMILFGLDAQVAGLRLDGHPIKRFNGLYQAAGDTAGWPVYKNPSGIFLFRRGTATSIVPADGWYLRSKLTPSETARNSYIQATNGPIPVGHMIWKVWDDGAQDDACVAITVNEVTHADYAVEQQVRFLFSTICA